MYYTIGEQSLSIPVFKRFYCKVCLIFARVASLLKIKEILHIERKCQLKNRVEEVRKKNEKQEELAYSVGVSRQMIISIEHGKYNPSLFLHLS